MPEKNEEITVEITGMTSDGNGVGRADGLAVFVPGTCVGDRVLCRIIKPSKNYAVGKLLTVLCPSADRVESECPVSSVCGGCTYRQMTYEAELEIKRKKVADAFARVGGISVEPQKTVGSVSPDRYRNKAMLPVARAKDGRLLIGFYAPRSHRVTDCRSCMLSPADFDDAVAAAARWIENSGVSVYDELTGRGLVRHIYMRRAPATGEMIFCLVINGRSVPDGKGLVKTLTDTLPGITGILLNVNTSRGNKVLGSEFITLYGRPEIRDTLCSLTFEISPPSFYQVNSPQAERLYNAAAECAGLSGNELLLDLYCGAGTIGLSMADRVSRVIGVEIIPEAVENAKRNAELNGITNARFICADASKAAADLRAEGVRPDVVVLDPPRKGLDKDVISIVADDMAPSRIVYISCDPATCARDCAVFKEHGYEVKELRPFDLFPRTAHVECVACLKRYSDNR
ncbi:MAG: 23S rRNA (uracil(1939)-C(5))-methyltransferase RlmD [Clostridia bacterium]|nr:23S rRNA (uracil(1939)-C(5))-methyltransferase RlmD [Clostridia bacterium]